MYIGQLKSVNDVTICEPWGDGLREQEETGPIYSNRGVNYGF